MLDICSYGVHLRLFLQIGYRFRALIHLGPKKICCALSELIDDIIDNLEEVGIHYAILRFLIAFNIFQLTVNLLFSDLNHQVLEVVTFKALAIISTLNDGFCHEIDDFTVAL